ncbi:hypothetical protein DYB25_006275 [Aphanomyces astaci]|uniref:Cyclic nucleotide-binding domain-containing protein n=1 Tax=Aphanomyces astaci TaxID=112090 RepID=A0A397BPJ0_APHAT|nr:hypothetical protein DYB25_006275 [Aphanomyces astaci]
MLTTAAGVIRFKKKLQERAEEAERKRLEIMSYATRHQHVLDTYQIRTTHTVLPRNRLAADKKKAWMMLYPTSNVFKLWQLLLLVLVYYQMLAVPYSLAFESTDTNPTNDFVNIATSLVFCLDVVLQFNTALSHPRIPNTFITDRQAIAKQYVTGWCDQSLISSCRLSDEVRTRCRFLMDLLSSIPVDFVTYLIEQQSSERHLHVLAVLKVARLPRLIKISRLSRILEFLRLPLEWKRWFLYSRYAHLIRLMTLVLAFGVTVHLFACVWFGMVADDDWAMVIYNANFEDVDPYLLSFYMSLQTILGQNQLFQSDHEYSFSSIVILVGAVVMAVVFGNVAILISNFYNDQNRYKGKMETLFSGMQLLRLPRELQMRIHEYYQAMYERYGTLDGNPENFKDELSKNLRVEVELFLRMAMIVRTPLFRACSNEVVRELVMKLRFQVYLPDDFVIVRGEVGYDMYFIQDGACQVTKAVIKRNSTRLCPKDGDTAPKRMGQGDYFGEIALLLNCKRTANVQAVEFSELCVLSREMFEDVTSKYTEDRAVIEKFITEKYDPDVLKQAVAQHDQNHGSDASSHDDAVVECIRKLTERVIQVETLVMDLESRFRMQQHFQSMAVKHSPGMSASPSQSHMSRQTSIQRGMVARQPSVSALLAAPPSLSIMRASISKPSLHNGSGTALAGQTSGDAGMATGAASSLVTQLALDRSSSRRHISPVL